MTARGDYSYENMDGIGDDASTDSRDSRARTDPEESTDDMSKNEEDSIDDDAQSSQHTDVAVSEDVVGSRPLLEDDGLEEDEDFLQSYDFVDKSSVPSAVQNQASNNVPFSQPLYIDASRAQKPLPSTNPFLCFSAADNTPQISPNRAAAAGAEHVQRIEIPDWGDDCTDRENQSQRRDTIYEKPCLPFDPCPPLDSAFAPATLPRQSTPLVAAPRLPSAGSRTNEDNQQNEGAVQHQEPTVGTLIQVAPPELPSQPPVTKTQPTVLKSTQQMPVGLSTVAPLSQSAVLPQNPRFEAKYPPIVKQTLENPLEEAKPTASPLLSKHAGPTFIEGPKTPKPKKSNKDKKTKKEIRSSGSELETDGSEAEIFAGASSEKASSSKKKKSGFSLRGNSNPSVTPVEVALSTAESAKNSAASKKAYGKRSSVPNSKKSTSSATNASFVNSSFQAEDIESPPNRRGLRL
ncbi:hypothetical protein WR25_15055 isoform B [Diploscapter pachys]|uniref:Uncharacterized protein n=1 Tax=Diploscapter pachys TaxID=2018661 RepID=A0A2A2L0F7_9BILA|nr:hypothetical protein WR25_15055 isoform A [Diploscapter pachys]PAV79731.1 hypothetical protein WR25_15055 isoform B [Diploscapter pachys]